MNYTKEAREIKQSYYGTYCEMCRSLNIKPIQYCLLTNEKYDEVKKLFKEDIKTLNS